LQTLLKDDTEVCSHVGDLVEVYKSILAEDVCRTHLAHMINTVHLTQKTADIAYDEDSLHETSLSNAIIAALTKFLHCKHPGLSEKDGVKGSSASVASSKAKVLDRFSLHGVQYSTASHRACDSQVFFQPPLPLSEMSELKPSPEPGQITHIFLHPQALAPCHPTSPGQHHQPPIYICV